MHLWDSCWSLAMVRLFLWWWTGRYLSHALHRNMVFQVVHMLYPRRNFSIWLEILFAEVGGMCMQQTACPVFSVIWKRFIYKILCYRSVSSATSLCFCDSLTGRVSNSTLATQWFAGSPMTQQGFLVLLLTRCPRPTTVLTIFLIVIIVTMKHTHQIWCIWATSYDIRRWATNF